MKIAILSDIHSNFFALEQVIKEAKRNQVSHFFILGDIFGYYPWAVETYQLIHELESIAICGNHDLMMLSETPPHGTIPDYWPTLVSNRKILEEKTPEALKWLSNLTIVLVDVVVEDLYFSLYHGTPSDPVNGRFYPDNIDKYDWFPRANNILLLGHTHYPLIKSLNNGGVIINPGSVGQPRDGNTSPSWAIFDTKSLSCEFKRTEYNIKNVTKHLQSINWNPRAIKALNKNYKGTL